MSDERELLAELSQVTSESRLSCQIEFTEALAGLKVTTRRTNSQLRDDKSRLIHAARNAYKMVALATPTKLEVTFNQVFFPCRIQREDECAC